MKTGIICVGNNIFETLLAISFQEQERGLMYLDPPTPNMAFLYERPQFNKFWMANTKVPLDIIFCHAGEITQICVGEPYSTAMIGDDRLSDLVVEFPFGTVLQTNIKLGYKINFLKPSSEELKQIIAKKYNKIVKI